LPPGKTAAPPAKAIALMRSTISNNGAPPFGFCRKMTIVAAGVATGSGSPLIGWLRSSVSMHSLKHAFT
jgi:hypothetical protein